MFKLINLISFIVCLALFTGCATTPSTPEQIHPDDKQSVFAPYALDSPALNKLRNKLKNIIIDYIELEEITIPNTIEYLYDKSIKHDPKREGINIVLILNEEEEDDDDDDDDEDEDEEDDDNTIMDVPRLGGHIYDIPLGQQLLYTSRVANLKYRLVKDTIVLASKNIRLDNFKTKIFPINANHFKNGTTTRLKTFLTHHGCQFPVGSQLFFDGKNEYIVAKNTPFNLEHIEKVLDEVNAMCPQVFVEITYLRIPEEKLIKSEIQDVNWYLVSKSKHSEILATSSLTGSHNNETSLILSNVDKAPLFEFTITPKVNRNSNAIDLQLKSLLSPPGKRYSNNLCPIKSWPFSTQTSLYSGTVNLLTQNTISEYNEEKGKSENICYALLVSAHLQNTKGESYETLDKDHAGKNSTKALNEINYQYKPHITETKLKNTIVKNLSLKNVTLLEAVTTLHKRYPKVRVFIKLDPEQLELLSKRKINIYITKMSFLDVIHYISLSCDIPYHFEDNVIIFSEEGQDLSDLEFININTKPLPIKTISESIKKQLKSTKNVDKKRIIHTYLRLDNQLSPFTSITYNDTTKQVIVDYRLDYDKFPAFPWASDNIKEYLKKRLITCPGNTTIAYDKRSMKLISKNTRENNRLIKQLVDITSNTKPYINTKILFIESTRNLKFTTSAEDILKQLLSSPDSNILAAPEIQSATKQIQEFSFKTNNTKVKLTVFPTLLDDNNTAKLELSSSFITIHRQRTKQSTKTARKLPQNINVKANINIKNAATILTGKLKTASTNHYLYIFTQAKVVFKPVLPGKQEAK